MAARMQRGGHGGFSHSFFADEGDGLTIDADGTGMEHEELPLMQQ
jgi:hypothetical protein